MMLARRRRLAVLAVVALLVVVLIVVLTHGGGEGASSVRPFHFSSKRDRELASRAAAGVAHGLYVNSPDGVVATAERVAHWRPLVDKAAARGDVDPDALEAVVFLESAGRADAIAGTDPAAASGLTQILPDTATSLLKMHVDLAASRRLTAQSARAARRGHGALAKSLLLRRARVDDRFSPAKALAGTVRYLDYARDHLHRDDLALVSYHMGVGNVQSVLAAYGKGTVSYPTVFFGSAPDDHAAAWTKLSSLGDESSLYYWKVLAAADIMRRYRTDRSGLERLEQLQDGSSAAHVLHPPGSARSYADDAAVAGAIRSGALDALPAAPAGDGLRFSARMPTSERALRPTALKLLEAVGARVAKLTGTGAPLTVLRTVASDPTGWSFVLSRHYADPAQGEALQFVLDRLTALDAIAWSRSGSTIRVTVAADVPGL